VRPSQSVSDESALWKRLRIAVSIVDYKSLDDTSRLVDALCDSSNPPVDISVTASGVDLENAALDGLRQRTTVSEPGYNTGYGVGHNVGIARLEERPNLAEYDWLLILNPDVQIASYDGFLESIFRQGLPPERIGAFSPIIENGDGSIWYGGAALDFDRAGFPSHLTARSASQWQETAYACGAAMFIRPEAFEAVGGFPEQYFLYFEEPDLAQRLRELGYEIAVCHGATVVHQRSWSIPPPYYIYYFVRNFFLFAYAFDLGTPTAVQQAVDPWLASQRRRVLARHVGASGHFSNVVQRACNDGQRLVTGMSLPPESNW
jgi:N-acetylglucosaminyl-diphospho-decaprenol L-rhamnosyltransferase